MKVGSMGVENEKTKSVTVELDRFNRIYCRFLYIFWAEDRVLKVLNSVDSVHMLKTLQRLKTRYTAHKDRFLKLIMMALCKDRLHRFGRFWLSALY